MSRLLLAVLLGNLSVCLTQQVTLAPPAQVKFNSTDYRNVLHWTPAPSNSSLQYDVQWKIYGEDDWLEADGCQSVQKLHCDLSAVTSQPTEWYYARVRASCPASSTKSAWTLSPRFSPRWDTKISPPALKLNVTEQSIVVRVKPPRALVRKLHSNLQYKIYVTHKSGKEEVFQMSCCSNKLTLKNLDHGSQYCLQAQTVVPPQAKTSARSSEKCVTTL